MRIRTLLVLFVALLPLTVTACISAHTTFAPAEVTATLETRITAWDAVVAAWPVTDEELTTELEKDLAAWTFLDDETTGVMAPSSYTSTVQSQKVAVEVTIMKLAAYDEAQRLTLVEGLLTSWQALEGYYDPNITPETGG